VRDCHIHHVGAGAIRLIGSHALIDNNYLHHLGLTYPSTIALYVGVTDPNMEDEWIFGKDETHAVISHNEIHDSPYIGIGIGGSHHVVEFNKISRVMLELEDGSGIYATFCADLIMRNNIVRDVEPGKSGLNHAYYLDELSSNVLVEKNISLDVPAASHSHMAEGNTYRNNIFISKQPMTITLPRCGPAATLV
jgi:nitrous oxidase accessory protein NosD